MSTPSARRAWDPAASAWAAALAAGTVLFFGPMLGNGFVNYDDPANILNNPDLGRWTPSGIGWAFSTTLGGHFQPLAWLSLSLDRAVWGLQPFGFHLTSLLLHAGTVVLLFALLRELLGAESDLPAAAGAALFAWHPLRVESVAWATERRDQLSLLFMLWSTWLYGRAVARSEREPKLGPALAAFCAAMLSKVFAAVLPAIWIALDRGLWNRKRSVVELAREKTDFWMVAVVAAALTVRAQVLSVSAPSLASSGVLERLSVFLWTPGWTLWKTILPFGLSPFVFVDWAGEPARFWPVAALTAALWGGLWAARRRPAIFWTGLAWLAALGPALGVFRSGGQSSADRYTLVPCAVLAVAAAAALKRAGPRAGGAALVVALLLGLGARAQTSVWANSVALWSRAREANPTSGFVATNLVGSLGAAGRVAEAKALQAALAPDPSSPAAAAADGDARAVAGDWDGAIADFAKAVAWAPEYAPLRVKYGVALYQRGFYDRAAEQFDAAVRMTPNDADARHLAALADLRLGKVSEGVANLERALAIDPSREDSRRLLAQVRASAAR